MRMQRENVEREVFTKEAQSRLEALGFTAMEGEAKGVQEETPVSSLESLTEAQLRSMAKKNGIKEANAKSREELLEALKEVGCV